MPDSNTALSHQLPVLYCLTNPAWIFADVPQDCKVGDGKTLLAPPKAKARKWGLTGNYLLSKRPISDVFGSKWPILVW